MRRKIPNFGFETPSTMLLTEEIEVRCRTLAAPLPERMARRIIKNMNKSLADQVQSDFARIGMNFFDQMALKHRDRAYTDFFFGFEDELDRMIQMEIDTLDPADRLVLDFRDLSVETSEERDMAIRRDIKAAFGSLLEQHLDTVRMQHYIQRYHLE